MRSILLDLFKLYEYLLLYLLLRASLRESLRLKFWPGNLEFWRGIPPIPFLQETSRRIQSHYAFIHLNEHFNWTVCKKPSKARWRGHAPSYRSSRRVSNLLWGDRWEKGKGYVLVFRDSTRSTSKIQKWSSIWMILCVWTWGSAIVHSRRLRKLQQNWSKSAQKSSVTWFWVEVVNLK